jgi:hypothetical protein
MTKIISDQKAALPSQADETTEKAAEPKQFAASTPLPVVEGPPQQFRFGIQGYGTTTQSVAQTTPLPGNNPIGIRQGSKVHGWIQRLGREPVVTAEDGTATLHFEPGESPFMGLPGDQVIGWDDGRDRGEWHVSASVSPFEMPRQPHLNAEERRWETEFVQSFSRDPRGMVKEYQSFVGDAHIYEVDLAKRCFPAYGRASKPATDEERRVRAEGNVALHQVATAVAKLAFLERLEKLAELPDDDPNKLVLVTTGGCAAGKGSLVDLLKVQQPDLAFGAVWDAAGENNALENPWILHECATRGIPAIFGYVHADPEQKIHAVLGRALDQGRMVDIVPFAYSYVDGAKNMAAFLESSEYLEAQAKGMASSFGLAPGEFNLAAIDDPTASPYPDAKPLPATASGAVEIPLHPAPRKVLDTVLDDIDRHSTEMGLPDAIMRSALRGLARLWPRQRQLLEGNRHV